MQVNVLEPQANSIGVKLTSDRDMIPARMRPRCHESLRREPQKAATLRLGFDGSVTDPMLPLPLVSGSGLLTIEELSFVFGY